MTTRSAVRLFGCLLSVGGIVAFVVGMIVTVQDAPSGSLSAKGADTPWLIFIGAACFFGGLMLATLMGGSARTRRRSASAASPAATSGLLGVVEGEIRVTPAAEPDDRLDRLGKLGALRTDGLLSEAEFEAEKARILDAP